MKVSQLSGKKTIVTIIFLLMIFSVINLSIVSKADETNFMSPTGTGAHYNDFDNPEGAFEKDEDPDASYALGRSTGDQQDYSNFGFRINPDATINGIVVEVEGTGKGEVNFEVKLSKTGGETWTVGKQGTFILSINDQVESLGGSDDLWGTTWRPSDLEDGRFSLLITNTGGSVHFDEPTADRDSVLGVDHIRVKVYYTTNQNEDPIAVDDSIGDVYNDVGTNLDILNNDYDPDGELNLDSITIIQDASHGTTSVQTGYVGYTPNEDYVGSDSFTYTVDDNEGATSNVATVTINVIDRPGSGPDAVDDGYSVDEGYSIDVEAPGVLENDDPGSGTIEVSDIITDPSHTASFSWNSDGSFTYEHDGSETTSDSFVYEISDGNGGTDQATVTITINPVNDDPNAVDDNGYSVDEGETLNIGAPGVLENDNDPESDTLEVISIIDSPDHSSSFDLYSNGSFTYEHDGSETTSDSFVYEISDGNGGTDQATVTITINPVSDPDSNNPPVLSNENPSDEAKNRPTSLTWSIDISDPDGDPFDWTIECSNGDANSGTDDSNGTKQLSISGLPYDTQYTVTVNVYDGETWTNDTFTFRTEENGYNPSPQPENNAPSIPDITGSEEGIIGGNYVFTARSTDSDGDQISYRFDWDDGTISEWTSFETSGEEISLSHSWSSPGSYNVKAQARDSEDTSSWSDSITISISEETQDKPKSLIRLDNISEKTVILNASRSYDPDGSIVEYFWDFGDEETETGIIATHEYDTYGEYFVLLTVTDNDGLNSTALYLLNLTSTINKKPEAKMFFSITDLTVSFDASNSNDADGDNLEFVWDFGDGTTLTTNETTIEYKYDAPGEYEVTLTVIDENGENDTFHRTVNVEGSSSVEGSEEEDKDKSSFSAMMFIILFLIIIAALIAVIILYKYPQIYYKPKPAVQNSYQEYDNYTEPAPLNGGLYAPAEENESYDQANAAPAAAALTNDFHPESINNQEANAESDVVEFSEVEDEELEDSSETEFSEVEEEDKNNAMSEDVSNVDSEEKAVFENNPFDPPVKTEASIVEPAVENIEEDIEEPEINQSSEAVTDGLISESVEHVEPIDEDGIVEAPKDVFSSTTESNEDIGSEVNEIPGKSLDEALSSAVEKRKFDTPIPAPVVSDDSVVEPVSDIDEDVLMGPEDDFVEPDDISDHDPIGSLNERVESDSDDKDNDSKKEKKNKKSSSKKNKCKSSKNRKKNSKAKSKKSKKKSGKSKK